MSKKHIYSDVINSLRKKRDVKVYKHQKKICILSNFIIIQDKKTKKSIQVLNSDKKFDIGNKTLSKIDYLVNHCHFHIFYFSNF